MERITHEPSKEKGFNEIDLSREKIIEPLDACRVEEGYFVVTEYSPEKPYLLTCGLAACKSIIFYNPLSQRGLMAHVSIVQNTERLILKLMSDFGSIDKSQCYIISGSSRADSSGQKYHWPTTDELIKEIQKFNPGNLNIDDGNNDGQPRGIVIDLEDGKVSEIDGSNGWTWSDKHDTSQNKKIEE